MRVQMLAGQVKNSEDLNEAHQCVVSFSLIVPKCECCSVFILASRDCAFKSVLDSNLKNKYYMLLSKMLL